MLVIASPRAWADDEVELANARAPGFVGDPLGQALSQLLAVRTRDGFALNGALPSDAQVWLDGFSVLGFHRDGRSVFTSDGVQLAITTPIDATLGDSAGGLALATSRELGTSANLSTRDAYATVGTGSFGGVVRTSLLGYAAPWFAANDRTYAADPDSQDVLLHRSSSLTEHLALSATLLFTRDQTQFVDDGVPVEHLRDASRAIVALRYEAPGWELAADQAFATTDSTDRTGSEHSLVTTRAFDSRETLRHAERDVAGLYELRTELGFEAHVTHYTLEIAEPYSAENVASVPSTNDVSHSYRGVIWTPDFAGSAGATALLAQTISLYAGARLDAFGSDLAISPRAALDIQLARTNIQLAAGGYRRAAERGDELEHPDLHPERTTFVNLNVSGAAYTASAYYADRTNLIVRDGFGTLTNTGYGTTYGVYALLRHHIDHWVGQLALRLEHDDRQDGPRGAVRPFEDSQPVRLEARLTRFVGKWQFGARFELREGMPYTRVVGNDYDSDRDSYTPLFGSLYAERLPWHHQLDLRIDRTWQHWSVFLDIANVYDNRSAVGYAYNFNFTQRRAIESLPIIPTLGVRGTL